MKRKQIAHTLRGYVFVTLGDFERAHKPAERAERFCPVIRQFGLAYHWSLDQVEFWTALVCRRCENLQAIYNSLICAAIHTVKPDNIAAFLWEQAESTLSGREGQSLQRPHRGISHQTHHG